MDPSIIRKMKYKPPPPPPRKNDGKKESRGGRIRLHFVSCLLRLVHPPPPPPPPRHHPLLRLMGWSSLALSFIRSLREIDYFDAASGYFRRQRSPLPSSEPIGNSSQKKKSNQIKYNQIKRPFPRRLVVMDIHPVLETVITAPLPFPLGPPSLLPQSTVKRTIVYRCVRHAV